MVIYIFHLLLFFKFQGKQKSIHHSVRRIRSRKNSQRQICYAIFCNCWGYLVWVPSWKKGRHNVFSIIFWISCEKTYLARRLTPSFKDLFMFFVTIFRDDITIFWDENLLWFLTVKKTLFWTNKKFVYLIFIPKYRNIFPN